MKNGTYSFLQGSLYQLFFFRLNSNTPIWEGSFREKVKFFKAIVKTLNYAFSEYSNLFCRKSIGIAVNAGALPQKTFCIEPKVSDLGG